MIYTDHIHLVADSLEELHKFAQHIGLKRCWFEGTMKGHPHYDLVNKKRKLLKNKQGFPFLTIVLKSGLCETVSDRKLLEISKSLL